MNELKLVSQTTPAIVSFNYDEINKHLDEVLEKYKGLVFTEATAAECKKTIAELKKGQKSLSDFRIKTKKVLTKDITDFEDQCKVLSNKFATVIAPISNQADEFEVKRREQKKTEIQTFIENLGDELEDKYYEQLVVTDTMLNKGTSMKSIKADLTKQADLLLSQQNIEKANIELIKSKVELANSKYGVTIPVSIYLRMLEDSEVTEVEAVIIEDAEKSKIEAEEKEAEEKEAERLEIEARKAERLAKVESDRLEREAKWAERERLAEINREAQNEKLQESKIETEVFVETYKIEGTESELNYLEDVLNANNYTWKVVE